MSNNQSDLQLRDSLYKDFSSSQRQVLEYKAIRPSFAATIQRLLDEHGFAQSLAAARQSGKPLRLLQLNCGEGLYLHELARLLEERNLLEGAAPTPVYKNVLDLGGPTEQGKVLLKNTILVLLHAGPALVKAGLLTQTQYDGLMETVYTELTPQHAGNLTHCTTLGHKPL